jgi:hypothetical protein
MTCRLNESCFHAVSWLWKRCQTALVRMVGSEDAIFLRILYPFGVFRETWETETSGSVVQYGSSWQSDCSWYVLWLSVRCCIL